jgi:signal transduction histidine kinase
MTATGVQHMEQNIARCRLVLSLAAIVAMYIDPAPPLLSRWIPLASGPFVMDFRLVLVMGVHLVYSALVYAGLWREWLSPGSVGAQTMWVDVLFGAVIGILTEGVTSPSFPFFAFAVMAAGLRTGLTQAIPVTIVSVGLYMCLIFISARGGADVYIMRPIYLAITGYLVGYLGQQRLDLQEEMRQFEAAEQRHRIARELHDGFAQALAGINLRLEGCRRLLRANPTAEILDELTELQDSVKREFDQLRSYTRSLAGLEDTAAVVEEDSGVQLSVRADLSGSVDLVDHVLQIVREGILNVRRHAHARKAMIEIRTDDAQVHVSIADDGVGFHGDAPPWSIASRVREVGGRIQIVADERPGAHLLITLPQG